MLKRKTKAPKKHEPLRLLGAPQKKCFLVVGPESSGTRLMTRLLMHWGCHGEGGHGQMFDSDVWWRHDPFMSFPDKIVWRRSLPHGGIWPDFDMMLRRLETEHYEPHVVITIRSLRPMVRSQVNAGHVRHEVEGEFKVLQALSLITNFVITRKVTYSMVTYEGLIHQPKLAKALARELRLNYRPFKFMDANAKHLR